VPDICAAAIEDGALRAGGRRYEHAVVSLSGRNAVASSDARGVVMREERYASMGGIATTPRASFVTGLPSRLKSAINGPTPFGRQIPRSYSDSTAYRRRDRRLAVVFPTGPSHQSSYRSPMTRRRAPSRVHAARGEVVARPEQCHRPMPEPSEDRRQRPKTVTEGVRALHVGLHGPVHLSDGRARFRHRTSSRRGSGTRGPA